MFDSVRLLWGGGRWPVAGGPVAGDRWPVAGGRWPVAGGAVGRWPVAGGRWPVGRGHIDEEQVNHCLTPGLSDM